MILFFMRFKYNINVNLNGGGLLILLNRNSKVFKHSFVIFTK